MANINYNNYIIVLEGSKIPSFEQLSEGKNYRFQSCKENILFIDSIQDKNYLHFYKVKQESQARFCVIKISQSKFLELEKIVSVLEGAIESIEWPKQNEIVAFDPDQRITNEIPKAVFVTSEPNQLIQNLFFVLLMGLILHDIWLGILMLAFAIIFGNKNPEENQRLIYCGVFTLLIGILCNTFIGNLFLTTLGEQTREFNSWINNFQLIEIFVKNNTLPFNQILDHYKITVLNFYIGLVLLIGLVFQLIKYVGEIILNKNNFRLQYSILRFFWICTILTFSVSLYLYFYQNFRNSIIWIPSIIFTILTLFYQTGNKTKNFLSGNYGVLEIIKAIFKTLPFGLLGFLGIITYWLTKEINSTFNIYLGEGWDYNKALVGLIITQSILGLIYCRVVAWTVRLVIKFAK